MFWKNGIVICKELLFLAHEMNQAKREYSHFCTQTLSSFTVVIVISVNNIMQQ